MTPKRIEELVYGICGDNSLIKGKVRAALKEAAGSGEANSESVEEIVGKMLRIYGVPFTDAISRKVAVETWARQLEDAALSGDQQP
jgi:hypothetical protein